MIKYLFTALLIVLGGTMEAQVNRVRNGGFEQHWRCPVTVDQVKFANFWSPIDTINTYPSYGDTFGVPYCTPDYINTCAENNFDVGAPDNARFYQYPRSGNGMMQLTMFFDESFTGPASRDYLFGRLQGPLISGKTYCLTFYVNFERRISGIPSSYAIDHIGAYLDNGAICVDTGIIACRLPKPAAIPQIYTTTIITDTTKWTKIQGNFIANGAENFITIGNLFDNAHINFIHYASSTPFAWYLVDDVSVIESTEIAHAGADKTITAGDSVRIGTSEEGMPCTWYVAGDTTAIGYSGGIWVKPDTTTTYVVEMDLCGNVTRDSVTVSVWAVGVPLIPKGEPLIWPNPVCNELHIDGAPSSTVIVYDVVGRVMMQQQLHGLHEVVDLSGLTKGVYVVHVRGNNEWYVRRVVKE